jgi:predicted AAA+ superfamily ATPase
VNYINRIIKVADLLEERSLFLFGPRQSGKTSYIKHQLSLDAVKTYNLLDQGLYQRILRDPTLIRQELTALAPAGGLVVIDEIQKCPELLDEVHLMIEEMNIRFLMTGSSARKLKRIGTNLLGGRARYRSFHPFVYPELKEKSFDLDRAINHGLVPYHYLSTNPEEDLQAYVGRYLTEEIAAEGLARSVTQFARFLQVAGTANAQLINYSSIANDAGVTRQTVQAYFDILRDTLLGYTLEPFTKTVKRKAITTGKFYFFDTGIVRVLKEIKVIPRGTKDFGDAFEHFLFLELRAFLDYMQPHGSLNFWRSKAGHEVDFILNKTVAIECKVSRNLGSEDFKGLRALKEEGMMKRYLLVCMEETKRVLDGITVYPWRDFLDDLWQGHLMQIEE